ncbi:MAG: DUF192 domain-containing protein, partial [Nitrospirota bacterium]
ARTPFTRIKGLLGRKDFASGQALILDPCNSIHTFFMHFPIDVLFVDKNNKALEALSNFNPNKVSRTYWHSRRVIELPAGTIIATNTLKNDFIQLL